jgi:hypothetical protein
LAAVCPQEAREAGRERLISTEPQHMDRLRVVVMGRGRGIH